MKGIKKRDFQKKMLCSYLETYWGLPLNTKIYVTLIAFMKITTNTHIKIQNEWVGTSQVHTDNISRSHDSHYYCCLKY